MWQRYFYDVQIVLAYFFPRGKRPTIMGCIPVHPEDWKISNNRNRQCMSRGDTDTTRLALGRVHTPAKAVDVATLFLLIHSVLWHCWSGDRKGIRPIKKLGFGLLVMFWLELSTSCSSSCCHHFHHPFSLRFNGHFSGEPGLADVYWSKGWWKWWWQLLTGAISRAKCKSNDHHQ